MEQLSLFGDASPRFPRSREPKLVIDREALFRWKQRLFEYQQRVRESEPPKQEVWPIVLYIGETRLSARARWIGAHDCKDYLMNYVELHRKYQLEVAPGSAFWHHVPPDKPLLRQWEKELILRWKPPFNRECWTIWGGQPFGKR